MATDEKRAREFFRSAVSDYDAAHYGQRSLMSVRFETVARAIEGLGLPPGADALDVGCGPGVLVAELCRQRFVTSGVDTSGPMLAQAERRFAAAGTPHMPHLQVAQAQALPFGDESFDLVCSTGMIEYLPDDGSTLDEFWRVLRPGGHVVLTITNFWSHAGLIDWFVEWAKRRRWLLAPFNRVWVARGHTAIRPREFGIRRHRPAQIRRSLSGARFDVERSEFFYMLPWPHPFDVLFPEATAALGERLEPLSSGPLGVLAEGMMVVARKPALSALAARADGRVSGVLAPESALAGARV
jgi:ubiquinone/menaquinone biosynthesis C-methylase UbiE